MRRVLIISTNRERSPVPVVPIGACAVAAALERAGQPVEVLDLCFASSPRRAIAEALRRPVGLIGLSTRNLDNADLLGYRSYLTELKSFVETARAASKARIVLGGPAVSTAPEALMGFLDCHLAVVGEGEEAIVELAGALDRGESTEGVPGVARYYRGRFSLTPPRPIADLNDPAPPRPWRWVNLTGYRNLGAPLPIQTKRGGGFGRVYCNYGGIEGRCARLKSPEAVADEIEEAVRETGIRHFEFVDSVLNAPQEHAIAVCEAIAGRSLDVRLHTSSVNPAETSFELFAAMRRAGFRSFVCSMESASERVLERMRKGFGVAEIARAMAGAQRFGLGAAWMLLFGGPGESAGTVRETLDFLSSHLQPPDIALASCGVRVLPGSPLETEARRAGLLPAAWNPLRPAFYLSPEIAPRELFRMLGDYAAGHPEFVFLADSRHPLAPALQRGVARLGLSKPFWHYGIALARLPGIGRLGRWRRRMPKLAYGVDVRNWRLDGVLAAAEA